MIKPAFEFIRPFVTKYPSITVLIVILLSVIWGYNDLNANKVNRDEFADMQLQLKHVDSQTKDIQTELKYMAKYFTGDTTFNDDIVTLPPQEYLIGIDTELLRNKFDSCLRGRVPDSLTGMPPYYCWCTDSTGKSMVVTFKYAE